jgi:hypothetical protein
MQPRERPQAGLTALPVSCRQRHLWVLGALAGLFAWCTAGPARATGGTISSPVAGPLTVNAGETLEIVAGGSVTVGSNAIAVTVNTGGTLRISGGTVSAGSGSVGVEAQYGGTATISAGSVSSYYGVEAYYGGTVNVTGGSVFTQQWGVQAYGGTATISGGTVSASAGAHHVVAAYYSGTATISGGSVSGGQIGVFAALGGTANISGGSVSADYHSVWAEGATANVSGGTIVGRHPESNGVIAVSGGTANISGGSVSAGYGVAVNGGTVAISGGGVSGGHAGVWTNNGTVNISGGTVSAGASGYGVVRSSTASLAIHGCGLHLESNQLIGTLLDGSLINTPTQGVGPQHLDNQNPGTPQITCPAHVVTPAASGACSASLNPGTATASDGCSPSLPVVAVRSDGQALMAPYPIGTTTITWTATYVSGSASCNQMITVTGASATPTITLNGANSLTVECHTSFSDPGATATACGGGVPVTASGVVNVNTPGPYTITYTATNGSNTATATRTVNVVDTTPPPITLNGSSTMTVECHGSFTDPGASANDTCAGSVAATPSGTVDVNTPGAYTLTYTATDGTNTVTATRTVTVVDTTPPAITLGGANPLTMECHGSFTDPGATATDACAGSVPVTVTGSVDVNTPGTYTLTYTASDGTNTATATRAVSVGDTAAPTLTLNGAEVMTVECHSTFTDPGATAEDSCAGNIPVTASGSVDVNTPGSYTLTYSVSDQSGNTATATRTVKVVDTAKPVITLNGSGVITVECHGSFTDLGATAEDGCAGLLSVSASGSVDLNTPGTYTLTYSATDPSGNTQTVTRTIHVVDTTPPTITAPANMTVGSAAGTCAARGVALGAPTTGDNCSVANVTNDAPSSFPVGSTTVTWTVTDGSGNTATATHTVTVSDAENPAITCPGNITVPQDLPSGTTLSYTVTATDNCPGVMVVSTPLSGSVFPLGTTTVTCTATDASGNTASCTFTVTVVTPPSTASARVTGGGDIAVAGGTATFGMVEITNADGQPKGNFTYQDRASGRMVKSTQIIALVISGTHARIFGKATVNGSGSFDFVLDVDDLAEPGANVDQFRIEMSDGYIAGGTVLSGGNVQIH